MWITSGLSYTLPVAPFWCPGQEAGGGGDGLVYLPVKPVETAAGGGGGLPLLSIGWRGLPGRGQEHPKGCADKLTA